MELRTLLRANIKHKKGAFISVMILTLLITAMAASVLAARKNYDSALARAQEEAGVGDANIFIARKYFTDELRQSVENSSLVKDMTVAEAVIDFGKVRFSNGKDDGNSSFFRKLPDGIRLYTPSGDGFEDTVPKLKKGELYAPYGISAKVDVKIGDSLQVEFQDGTREFRIAGFVQEPMIGAMMIGWKQYFISDEDYDELYASVSSLSDGERSSVYRIVRVFKADDELSAAKFTRELNLETGIVTKSSGVITKEQSETYTALLMIIILDVVLSFSVVLFVIVLIVIAHSIRSEIEIDYQNLGILKAQGFTDRKITQVIFLRYALAEAVGMVIGIGLSVLLERVLSGIFCPITAVCPDSSLALGSTAAVITAMLALSALIVFISTRRLARISPVRAISGGRQEVWFQSRLNAPITKRGLTASVAYRAFSSNFTKYIGIVSITALLAFFTVTVNVMSDSISSRSAMESMGMAIADVEIRVKDEKAAQHIDEIEAAIEKYTPISRKYYESHQYYSLDGENVICVVMMRPEYTSGMLEGRKPLYDNEIIITTQVRDALDLRIGDEVTVSGRREEAKFTVSGLFQTGSDAGYAFGMSLEGAQRLGAEYVPYLSVAVEDTSKIDDIAEELNSRFGDLLSASAYHHEEDVYDSTMRSAGDGIKIMIYAFSGIFALVAVIMVCSKAFAQERTDLGVYKAIGFTSGRLRRQFTVRFLIIAVIGSILGAFAGSLWSDDLLNTVFSMFGIVKLYPDSTPLTYIGGGAFICLCTAVFAFIASRKVKKIAVRELITE
ncbi:MAG: FtsX-like permease family protein [Ruminococcus sp.]|nr:FtsX-like permease family protein [Ruminococcus sp.]